MQMTSLKITPKSLRKSNYLQGRKLKLQSQGLRQWARLVKPSFLLYKRIPCLWLLSLLGHVTPVDSLLVRVMRELKKEIEKNSHLFFFSFFLFWDEERIDYGKGKTRLDRIFNLSLLYLLKIMWKKNKSIFIVFS